MSDALLTRLPYCDKIHAPIGRRFVAAAALLCMKTDGLSYSTKVKVHAIWWENCAMLDARREDTTLYHTRACDEYWYDEAHWRIHK